MQEMLQTKIVVDQSKLGARRRGWHKLSDYELIDSFIFNLACAMSGTHMYVIGAPLGNRRWPLPASYVAWTAVVLSRDKVVASRAVGTWSNRFHCTEVKFDQWVDLTPKIEPVTVPEGRRVLYNTPLDKYWLIQTDRGTFLCRDKPRIRLSNGQFTLREDHVALKLSTIYAGNLRWLAEIGQVLPEGSPAGPVYEGGVIPSVYRPAMYPATFPPEKSSGNLAEPAIAYHGPFVAGYDVAGLRWSSEGVSVELA